MNLLGDYPNFLSFSLLVNKHGLVITMIALRFVQRLNDIIYVKIFSVWLLLLSCFIHVGIAHIIMVCSGFSKWDVVHFISYTSKYDVKVSSFYLFF